jgi:F0F1-type ATP synthase membrane subunit b/b'
VIFILNYLVVRKFFLRPINEILDARETETRTAETLYEDALARFNEAAAQMEGQLHMAKRDAAQLRDQYRGEAATYRQSVLDRTNGDARQILNEADAKLTSDVAVAKRTIVQESERLARMAAERLLGRAV